MCKAELLEIYEKLLQKVWIKVSKKKFQKKEKKKNSKESKNFRKTFQKELSTFLRNKIKLALLICFFKSPKIFQKITKHSEKFGVIFAKKKSRYMKK